MERILQKYLKKFIKSEKSVKKIEPRKNQGFKRACGITYVKICNIRAIFSAFDAHKTALGA